MKKGKIVTVIPSRLGSNRVPMKGMRILGDQTLIEHTLSSVLKSKHFSEDVYINSDAPEWSNLAEKVGVKFYQRNPKLATSESMIDDYLFDFICQVPMDYLAVITPTSPFISAEKMDAAWKAYSQSQAKTLITAVPIQTHCFYQGEALNLSRSGHLPRSQDLEPVHALNFSIAIYDAKFFKSTYEENGFAVLAGEIQTFLLDGFSAIDIDEEKDFLLAELALNFQEEIDKYVPKYSPLVEHFIREGKDTRT